MPGRPINERKSSVCATAWERPSSVISGAPAYDGVSLDGDALSDAIFTLAESYGVSESFLRVRLDRYDLLRTGRSRAGY